MSDAVTSPAVEAAYAELDAVTAQIAEKNGEVEGLYERRRAAFVQLRTLGVAQAAIARHCGLSPMAVAFSIKGNDAKTSRNGKKRRGT